MSKFMIENAQIAKAQTFQPIVSGNTPEIVNIADSLGKIAEWHDEISAIKNGTNIDSFGDVETALSGKLNTSDVDTALSSTSTNPVQNKVVQAPVARLVDAGAKNLLKITRPSQTINGVTFTVNDDGTVSVNGTNNTSSLAAFYLTILSADTAPNYNGCRLTGCPSGGSVSTYRLAFQLNSGSYNSYASDIGGGSPIRDVPSSECRVAIIVYAGVTASNMIFKPMICSAADYAISTTFTPYAPTNRELYEEKIDHDIPALTGSILGYAVSLPVGIYFARHGSDSGTDKPETGKRYMYQIMRYSSATMTLIAYEGQGSNSNSIYMKNYTSNTWGPWVKFTGTIVT